MRFQRGELPTAAAGTHTTLRKLSFITCTRRTLIDLIAFLAVVNTIVRLFQSLNPDEQPITLIAIL